MLPHYTPCTKAQRMQVSERVKFFLLSKASFSRLFLRLSRQGSAVYFAAAFPPQTWAPEP